MMCDSLWQIENGGSTGGGEWAQGESQEDGLGHTIKLIIATWRYGMDPGAGLGHPKHVPSATSLLWFICFHLLSLGSHKI